MDLDSKESPSHLECAEEILKWHSEYCLDLASLKCHSEYCFDLARENNSCKHGCEVEKGSLEGPIGK